MKLNLNLEGFYFIFELKEYDFDYRSKEFPAYWWCKSDIAIEDAFFGNDYLRYETLNQNMMCDEVDYLISRMNDFLEGKFDDENPKNINFYESELEFSMGKNNFEVALYFGYGKCNTIVSQSNLTFSIRNMGNVEAFRDYLLLATGKITPEDERIQKLIEDGIIIP